MGVGYKGLKSGSGSKLVEAIAGGCGEISRLDSEGVEVGASGSTPYPHTGAAQVGGKFRLAPCRKKDGVVRSDGAVNCGYRGWSPPKVGRGLSACGDNDQRPGMRRCALV